LRNRRGGRTRRRLRLGLLRDRLQHIARLGDVRQVDLGLEFIHRRTAARTTRSTGLAVLLVVVFDLLGLIDLDGARVCLLLGNSDLAKNVEDHLALNLEFACQIIDSDF
jgi:hypothetical protein